MTIELSDDGSLDTVLRCSDCGEEMRYNYDPEGTDERAEELRAEYRRQLGAGEPSNRIEDRVDETLYDEFIAWAIEDATADHECQSADDSEPSEPQVLRFQSFESWAQLIDHIRAEYPLYYHAPLDYRPVLVSAVVRKDGKLRVHAPYGDSDPFTADTGHLPRFQRLVRNAHLMDLTEGK